MHRNGYLLPKALVWQVQPGVGSHAALQAHLAAQNTSAPTLPAPAQRETEKGDGMTAEAMNHDFDLLISDAKK